MAAGRTEAAEMFIPIPDSMDWFHMGKLSFLLCSHISLALLSAKPACPCVRIHAWDNVLCLVHNLRDRFCILKVSAEFPAPMLNLALIKGRRLSNQPDGVLFATNLSQVGSFPQIRGQQMFGCWIPLLEDSPPNKT